MPGTQNYFGFTLLEYEEQHLAAHHFELQDHSERRNLLPGPGAVEGKKKVHLFYVFLFSLNKNSKSQPITPDSKAAVLQTLKYCKGTHSLLFLSESICISENLITALYKKAIPRSD